MTANRSSSLWPTAGIYGTFSIDANGNWVYSLNNEDPRVQALGVGRR